MNKSSITFPLIDIDKLKNEQRVVFNSTTLESPAEFILVQGVAGSGKTTIALNIARKIANDSIQEPNHRKRTVLFLTYNQNLVDFCQETLKGHVEDPNLIWQSDEQPIKEGHVNVLTYRRFSELFINNPQNFITDAEAIEEIDEIRSAREYSKLLSPQIYSIITTFLKGRLEFRQLSSHELENYLKENNSPIIKIYRSLLLDIKNRIYGVYQNILEQKQKKDRSDLSYEIYKDLSKINDWLNTLSYIRADEINAPNFAKKKLSDDNRKLKPLFDWLRDYFAKLPLNNNEILQIRKKLNSNRINESHLNLIREKLFPLIREYGVFNTNTFDKVGKYLKNPVIIVDELQDLSQLEINTILSFWFQLPKLPMKSRLILFGDLNQQMTPTGFRWEEDIIESINKLAQIYKYDSNLFNTNWSFTDNENDTVMPFRKLNNNYRTTWHIAEAAFNMMKIMLETVVSDERTRRYFTDALIDPKRTYPEHIFDETMQVLEKAPDLLEPVLIVCEKKEFLSNIKNFCKELEEKFHNSFGSIEKGMKSLVIITEHPKEVARVKDELNTKEVLTYYPILECKGLEFQSCIIWGLPIKRDEEGNIELDVIGQWYTSLTRPKVKLLLVLSPEEEEFLNNKNWLTATKTGGIRTQEEDSWWESWKVSTRENIFLKRKPEELIDAIKNVGTVVLSADALKSAGDIAFNRFRETLNEASLKEAINYYEKGNWENEKFLAQKRGAKILEKNEEYLKAANYYEKINDIESVVRCYVRESERLKEIDPIQPNNLIKDAEKYASDFNKKLKRIENNSEFSQFIENFYNTTYKASKSWLWLKKWGYSLNNARDLFNIVASFLNNRELLDHEVYFSNATKKIVDDIIQISNNLIQQNVFKLDGIEYGEGSKNNVYEIISILEQQEFYDAAGQVCEQLNDWERSVRNYLAAKNFNQAENVATKAGSESKKCWKLIANSYLNEDEEWLPNTFYAFYFADIPDTPPINRDEFPAPCLKILNEIKESGKFELEIKCWIELARRNNDIAELALTEVRAIPHVLNSKKEYEKSIKSWKICREEAREIPLWKEIHDQIAAEELAKCWMKIYDREIDRKRLLIGPEKRDFDVKRISFLKEWLNHIKSKISDTELINNIEKDILEQNLCDQLKNNIEKIIEELITQPQWQSEFTGWLNNLKKIFENLGINDEYVKSISILSKQFNIKKANIEDLQEKLGEIVIIFTEQAAKIGEELLRIPGREIEGIHILYHICRLKKHKEKAEKEIKDFWKKGDRIAAINCWKYLELFDVARLELLNLELKNDDDLKLFMELSSELYDNSNEKLESIFDELESSLKDQSDRDSKTAKRLLEVLKKLRNKLPVSENGKDLSNLLKELIVELNTINFEKKETVITLIKNILEQTELEIRKILWNNEFLKNNLSKINHYKIKNLVQQLDEKLSG